MIGDLQRVLKSYCVRLWCSPLTKLSLWRYNEGTMIFTDYLMPDHIHMLVSIPPKMSISSFMGYKLNISHKLKIVLKLWHIFRIV